MNGTTVGWVTAEPLERWGQSARMRRLTAWLVATSIAIVLAIVPLPARAGAAGGWTVVTTTPPVFTSFSPMTCPTTSDCFAIASDSGSGVAVVGSTTGGATWSVRYVPPAGDYLDGLSCTSGSSCALGVQARTSLQVLFTGDGGATWSSTTLPGAGSALAGVWCATPTACDVATQSNAPSISMLTTMDAGKSWTVHRAAVQGYVLSGLACVALSECFLGVVTLNLSQGTSVTELLRTIDRGTSWKKQSLSKVSQFAVPEVACTSLHRCIATIGDGSSGYAYSSSNAGNSWRLVGQGPRWATRIPQCDASGDCDVALGSLGGHALVGLSTDGGATWKLRTFGQALSASGTACASPVSCVVAAGRADLPYTSPRSVFSTADGGASWSKVYVQTGVTSIASVDCPTALSCIATGSTTAGGYVTTSGDAGVTWTPKPALASADSLSSVTCLSATKCLAIASSGPVRTRLIQTSDDASTWTNVTLPDATQLQSVTCTSVTTCFAIAQGSLSPELFVTSNAAASWSTASLPGAVSSIDSLESVACPSSQHCVAVATESQQPVFLSSADAGKTWTTSMKVRGSDFWLGDQMSCTSSLDCVSIASVFNLFGSSGFGLPFLYVTTDGGTTWSPRFVFSERFSIVTGLQCTSDGTCHAVASQFPSGGATFVSSPDGGLSWSVGTIPLGAATAMSCTSGSACVAVGSGLEGGWAITQLT